MAMAWGNDELCPLHTFFHNHAFLDWLDLPRSPSDALFVHRFQGHAHLPSRLMTVSQFIERVRAHLSLSSHPAVRHSLHQIISRWDDTR